MIDRHYSQERIEVANAYPGANWRKKVIGMSDGQVHEIYVNLMKRKEKARLKKEQNVKGA